MVQQQTSVQNPSSPPSPPPPTTASPPSPSHEFSFTVSLRPHPPPNSTQHRNTINNHKSNTTPPPPPPPPPPAVIDLSPADDIFFHGHLLPLHFLSHLPISPRSSTNSMDSFTLPIKHLYDQNTTTGNTSFHCHHENTFSDLNPPEGNPNPQKSKSFSIFGKPKWRKGCQRDQDQDKERKSDLPQLIKRYMKMIRPLLSFPKKSNTKFNRQSYSFSGNLPSSGRINRPREMKFSAPASLRTSPANSGILASGTVSPAKSIASDSTMEELHAAIQAAIAHCKNSIAMEDNIQSQG